MTQRTWPNSRTGREMPWPVFWQLTLLMIAAWSFTDDLCYLSGLSRGWATLPDAAAITGTFLFGWLYLEPRGHLTGLKPRRLDWLRVLVFLGAANVVLFAMPWPLAKPWQLMEQLAGVGAGGVALVLFEAVRWATRSVSR